MKTFSDIKRSLTEGTIVTMIRHDYYPNGPLINKPRKIEKKQSNAIMFEGGSWLYFDKPASHFIPHGFNEFSVLLNPDDSEPKYMTYRISYDG